MLIDNRLAKSSGQQAKLLAMMMDFVPESIALGTVFAIKPQIALLLATFIDLQNLLEVFNSFRDLTAHLIFFVRGIILYLIIQDIIPESKLDNNYLT